MCNLTRPLLLRFILARLAWFRVQLKMAVSRVLVGSVGVAMLLVGLVAYMGSSPSTTVTHEEMLESPLFYHGSNGNGVCIRSAPRRFVVRHC